MSIRKRLLAAVSVMASLVLLAAPARAGSITFSGLLNDPANGALVGAGPFGDTRPAPLFGDDYEVANNTALYDLVVPVSGTVRFESIGYGAGGADPYFTLLSGAGDTATFALSNFDQAFSTRGDFDISAPLMAGTYLVAMGVFANMSLAENRGSGSLGDGFSGLGVPEWLGSSYYELRVTYPDQEEPPAVPEPATLFLLAAGMAGLSVMRRRRTASR